MYGSVEVLQGDLLTCEEQYIIHQVSCVIKGRAGGLARLIFQKFPYANVYLDQGQRQYGSIEERGDPASGRRLVLALFSQYYAGIPSEGDTAQERISRFKECLERVSRLPLIRQAAFPFGFGCGLAGGSWMEYLAVLIDWAAKHPKIRVRVYKLASSSHK